ncbi:hypothetical protein BD309DRAFT_947696 [Dichomitus squalens]|nr:hypothetical protein BD309DRAFT_947696 [Dichomitus squalens]
MCSSCRRPQRALSPAVHTRCLPPALKARIHSIDFGCGATRHCRCILPRALRRRKRCAYEYAASMSSLATVSGSAAR